LSENPYSCCLCGQKTAFTIRNRMPHRLWWQKIFASALLGPQRLHQWCQEMRSFVARWINFACLHTTKSDALPISPCLLTTCLSRSDQNKAGICRALKTDLGQAENVAWKTGRTLLFRQVDEMVCSSSIQLGARTLH